jgi:hypothetical protein
MVIAVLHQRIFFATNLTNIYKKIMLRPSRTLHPNAQNPPKQSSRRAQYRININSIIKYNCFGVNQFCCILHHKFYLYMENITKIDSKKICLIISQWKLNKVLLASKMNMNSYTFKMKISGNDHRYFFTQEQLEKLTCVLQELATEIQSIKQ